MKKFTLLILMCFVASFVFAQTTFNWEETILSEGNNLQQLHKYDDNSIIVVGNAGTFMKFDPSSGEWNKVGVLTPSYDYIDMSIVGGKGIMSSRRAKIINNPSGGNFDIYENGMLLKTEDNGATWAHVDVSALANMVHDSLNPLDAGSMAMDIFACAYIDDDNMLIYSGWYDYRSGSKVSRGAVFTTTDGGTTWSNLTGDLGSSIVNTLYNYGPNNYFGGLNMLYKNETGTTNVTDLYDAFTASAGDDSFYVSDITFAGPTTFYVVTTSDGIHLTTDDGATFTQLGGTAPTGGNDFYYHNANVMMALGSSSKSKATIDGGTTWTDVYPGTSCWEIAGVFNDSLVALAKSSIFKMAVTDLEAGNFNWVSSVVSDGNNLQKLNIVDNSNAFICGYGGTMMSTTDAGLNWTAVDCPEPITPIAEEVDFNSLTYAGGVTVAAARRFKLIDYDSGSEFTDMTVDGLVFVSDDNFASWEIYDITDVGITDSDDVTLNPDHDDCHSSDPYTVTITNDSTIYAWLTWYAEPEGGSKTTHSRVFKSTNSGETWASLTRDFGNSFITDINFVDEDNGFIAGNTVLLKTTDGGATFTDLYPALVVDPSDDSTYFIKGVRTVDMDEFYITTTSNGIFKTTDGGANFTIFDETAIAGGNDFFKIDDYAYMVLGTSSKSKYTKDGGTNWEDCYPGSSVWTIAGVINDSIWALAKGKIFKIAYDEVIYNVGIGEYTPQTNELNVKYAYNTIELTSTELEIEECTVYSITGEVVAKYTPYAQKCIIETSALSSGVYVATSMVGGKMYINKLWIVK